MNFLYGLPVINFSRTAVDIQNVPERRTKLSPLLKMIINIPPAAEQSSAAGSSALFGNLQRFELHHQVPFTAMFVEIRYFRMNELLTSFIRIDISLLCVYNFKLGAIGSVRTFIRRYLGGRLHEYETSC